MHLGDTLIPFTDEEDIEAMLMNSIGVLLDVNGRKDLLCAFMKKFVPDTQPVVVVALGTANNERKLKLVMEVLEKCSPAVVCGRGIDLAAIGEVILEKHYGVQNDSPDEEPTKDRSKSMPLLRTRKLHKTRSPSPVRKARDLHRVRHPCLTSMCIML